MIRGIQRLQSASASSQQETINRNPLVSSSGSTEINIESSNMYVAEPSTANSFVFTNVTSEPAATEVDPMTLWQYKRGSAILQYAPPFLIAMATVGNILSVVILQHPKFRKSSTSFILSALAVVDLEIVYTGLMRQWLIYQFNIDVRLLSSAGCKLHFFLVYCVPMVRFHIKNT
jgi:hypothetical protein